ncbi:hypothetical protein EV426DRAFT_611541 [Tirmania nivea]|nr:hypothetical protein EV426DRAFT_611541 [Tirmania nivea]
MAAFFEKICIYYTFLPAQYWTIICIYTYALMQRTFGSVLMFAYASLSLNYLLLKPP